MNKTKKRLSTLALAFTLVLVMGIVYAAYAGSLVFDATITLDANVKLEFYDETVAWADGLTDDTRDYTLTFDADRQTATLTATLAKASDELNIEFYIRNTGSQMARITSVTPTISPGRGTTIYDQTFANMMTSAITVWGTVNNADTQVFSPLPPASTPTIGVDIQGPYTININAPVNFYALPFVFEV